MTHKATLAVRTGIETDTQHGAVVPPSISPATTPLPTLASPVNTTMPAPATRPAPIWQTPWRPWKGAGAVVTGTGMGAVHLVTTALLKAGIC